MIPLVVAEAQYASANWLKYLYRLSFQMQSDVNSSLGHVMSTADHQPQETPQLTTKIERVTCHCGGLSQELQLEVFAWMPLSIAGKRSC